MKKISKVITLFLILALTFSLAACGNTASNNSSSASSDGASSAAVDETQQAIDAIKAKGTLTIALESTFAPFEYMDGDKVVGIDVDIAQYIADQWGVKLEVQDLAFDTALSSVANGIVDLGLSGISKTADREKNMNFSDPYFESNQVIVVKVGSTIKTMADLKDKKVGAQTGTTGESLAKEELGKDKITGYDKYTVAVQDLMNGQIDAIVMDAYPAAAAVAANEGKIIVLDEKFGSDSYCIAVKKDATGLTNAVNAIIKDLKDSGKLDQIIKKYENSL